MKKKKNKPLIFLIIGFALIISGAFAFMLKSSGLNDNDDNDENKKNEVKELRKIFEEEISDDSAKEIIQYYLDLDFSYENKKILKSKIMASNLDGKYFVRVELENDDVNSRYTSIQYLNDGMWSVELPLINSGIIPDEYIEFWGAEGE